MAAIYTMHERDSPDAMSAASIRQVTVEPMNSEFRNYDVDEMRPPYMKRIDATSTNQLIDYELERTKRRAALYNNRLIDFATLVAAGSGIALPRSIAMASKRGDNGGGGSNSTVLPLGAATLNSPAAQSTTSLYNVPTDNGTANRPLTIGEMLNSGVASIIQQGYVLLRQEEMREATQYLFKPETSGLIEIDPIIDANAKFAWRELLANYPRTLRDMTLADLINSDDFYVIFADLVAARICETNSGPASRRDHLRADYDRAAVKRLGIIKVFQSARLEPTAAANERLYDATLRGTSSASALIGVSNATARQLSTKATSQDRLQIAYATPEALVAPLSGYARRRIGA